MINFLQLKSLSTRLSETYVGPEVLKEYFFESCAHETQDRSYLFLAAQNILSNKGYNRYARYENKIFF